MRHIALALADAIRALPPVPVTGDQPAPHTDSHSYVAYALAHLADSLDMGAGDLAWLVAGLAICHAEAVSPGDI